MMAAAEIKSPTRCAAGPHSRWVYGSLIGQQVQAYDIMLAPGHKYNPNDLLSRQITSLPLENTSTRSHPTRTPSFFSRSPAVPSSNTVTHSKKMGDKSNDTFAQARSILSGRIIGYDLLMLDYVTPLLHKELLDATEQHEEMLQGPDPTTPDQDRVALQQLRHLDSVDAQLSEHWKSLNEGLISRTALLANIMGYQGFLARSILLDYAGHSPRETGFDSWVSDRVQMLELYERTVWRSNKNSDIKMYQQAITTPIRELMLDQDHVERRLRIATAEPYPTGEIYRLIDECDWSTLAMMLIRDRELAVTLYSHKSLDPDSYNDNISNAVFRKMDKIRDRYFTAL